METIDSTTKPKLLDSLLETSKNPTTTTNWGEVLPAKDQNDKICHEST